MVKSKRSLFECSHAICHGEKIVCDKGYFLAGKPSTETLRLKRGEPLEFTVCQGCPSFDKIGEPVAPEDRGWKC